MHWRDQMQSLGAIAVDALNSVLTDKNTTPATRLKAALAVLNYLTKAAPVPKATPAPKPEKPKSRFPAYPSLKDFEDSDDLDDPDVPDDLDDPADLENTDPQKTDPEKASSEDAAEPEMTESERGEYLVAYIHHCETSNETSAEETEIPAQPCTTEPQPAENKQSSATSAEPAESGFVPSPPDSAPQMPVFVGSLAEFKRKQWRVQHGLPAKVAK